MRKAVPMISPSGKGKSDAIQSNFSLAPAEKKLQVFPTEIFSDLPELLQKAIAPAISPEERDMLLLGSLTTLSACLPKFCGIYDGKKIRSNLFLFVTADASAGKGRMDLCKNLVLPIHDRMRSRSKRKKARYAADIIARSRKESDKKPVRPPEQMLFIPANNSSTGFFQLLADNKGQGLIFETEGDTMGRAFRSDFGNYSEGFRKAFHHETISYNRRTDKEYIDIPRPCLSTLLSGTPNQVRTLIPDAENGLFSRFLFYRMTLSAAWKNVFAHTEIPLEDYYLSLGTEFMDLYRRLLKGPETGMVFTEEQQFRFNAFFSEIQHRRVLLKKDHFLASIRRMGIIFFRLCMILTALRTKEGDPSEVRECEDRDFKSVLKMASVLLEHSEFVYDFLCEEKPAPPLNIQEQFLRALPETFTTSDLYLIGRVLKLPKRTLQRFIRDFVDAGLVEREVRGKYILKRG